MWVVLCLVVCLLTQHGERDNPLEGYPSLAVGRCVQHSNKLLKTSHALCGALMNELHGI